MTDERIKFIPSELRVAYVLDLCNQLRAREDSYRLRREEIAKALQGGDLGALIEVIEAEENGDYDD